MSHTIRPSATSTMGIAALAIVMVMPTPLRAQLNFDHYHRWEDSTSPIPANLA